MWLPLGRLPMDEAALCVRTHTTLRRLFFADDEGRELVERLLQVSGGRDNRDRFTRYARRVLQLDPTSDAADRVRGAAEQLGIDL